MLMNTFTSLPIAASGALVAWTIVAVLTFLLIGVPLVLLIVLTLASDDDAIDRAVHDMEQFGKLNERAHAYAWGKDVYGVLEKPLVLAPLTSANRTSASAAGEAPPAPVKRASARARSVPSTAAARQG